MSDDYISTEQAVGLLRSRGVPEDVATPAVLRWLGGIAWVGSSDEHKRQEMLPVFGVLTDEDLPGKPL
jgi:hypothetical protein